MSLACASAFFAADLIVQAEQFPHFSIGLAAYRWRA